MSELMNACQRRKDFRWHLLLTASALPLLAAVYGSGVSEAADEVSAHPTVWLEIGGQLEQQSGQGEVFVPPFVTNYSSSSAYKPDSPMQSMRPPRFSNGIEGKITFEPDDSDWVFSAKVRYGRANNNAKIINRGPEVQHHTQFAGTSHGSQVPILFPPFTVTPSKVDFSDTRAMDRESHLILDFEAGKDMGLGIFGLRGTSTLNAGVRIAQLASKTSGAINAIPDLQWQIHHINRYQSYFPSVYLHNYRSNFHVFSETNSAQRSFRGLGPMISWNASTPIFGRESSMELTFDWGVNAALLFGRQSARGQHHESGHFKASHYNYTNLSYNSQYYSHSAQFSRRKSVVVPNLGSFAGVSFKFPNAKVSFGYRGDFFFGAMDAGFDSSTKSTVGFSGPFATISIGLGG